jgi:hypothetical protein
MIERLIVACINIRDKGSTKFPKNIRRAVKITSNAIKKSSITPFSPHLLQKIAEKQKRRNPKIPPL